MPLLPTNFTKKSYLIHWFLSRFTDNSAAAYFLGHPEDDSQRLQNGVVQTIYDTVSKLNDDCYTLTLTRCCR